MLSYKYNCSKCGFGTDSMLSMSMHIGGCVLKRSPSTFTHLLFFAIIVLFFAAMGTLNASAQTEPPPDWCKSPCECAWIDGAWFCVSHTEKPYIVNLPLIYR